MATVKIIEQPTKVMKFRYEREGRSGGLIVGASSTPQNKTYPKIQIEGYRGRALVIVSCVTKDEPHRPHPHKLVGRDSCRKGVCSMEVSPETMSVEFTSLGIQCMRRRDIEESLKIRKDIRVDPFRTGFAFNQSNSFDLTAVRLCFQVLLQDKHGEFTVPLTPVVSEPLYDRRAISDLTIVTLSKCVSPVDGGQDPIILLCEKVVKNDIQIRFYQEQDGQLVWEDFGIFQPSDIHKQVAIRFRPPRYQTLTVAEPVKVFLQLQRPSDGERSESVPFQYLPTELERKKLNPVSEKSRNLLRYLSAPPLLKQQRSDITYPESAQIYRNISPIDLPNPNISESAQTYSHINPIDLPNLDVSVQQQPYSMPMSALIPTPLMELNEPSTSGTAQHLDGGNICDLSSVRIHNLPSSSQEKYSTPVHLLSSISPPNNLNGSFPFPISQNINNYDTETPMIETPNNSGEIGIHNLNDLSRLLINATNQQTELQELNFDSGELDAMNISS